MRLPSRIDADVVKFLSLAESGQRLGAALLYQSDLLAGIEAHTPKLRGWLEERRKELASKAFEIGMLALSTESEQGPSSSAS